MGRKLVEARKCLGCNYTLCIYSFDGEICDPPEFHNICAICGAKNFIAVDISTLDECKHESKIAPIENSNLN